MNRSIKRHQQPWGWGRRLLFGLLIIIGLALGVAFYGYKIEPHWVQVVSVDVTLPHLAPEFDGYRVVQLSDIHIEGKTSPEYLQKVIRKVNQQKPDVIALTGDFVTSRPEKFAPQLSEFLRQLQSQERTVAVLGNHDQWSDPTVVRQALQQGGVKDISNGVYPIRRGAATLYMAGVDDYWVGAADLEAVLKQLPGNDAAILLVHEPDFADQSSKTRRFDLELSGHSHGGQVAIPGFTHPKLPPYG
ncbi:MAG: metallophosphoesterase [Microcoleaceae cyanobacterium]